jgi:hypothetical protein
MGELKNRFGAKPMTPPHVKPSWGKFSEKKVRMLCLTGREI